MTLGERGLHSWSGCRGRHRGGRLDRRHEELEREWLEEPVAQWEGCWRLLSLWLWRCWWPSRS